MTGPRLFSTAVEKVRGGGGGGTFLHIYDWPRLFSTAVEKVRGGGGEHFSTFMTGPRLFSTAVR